MSISRLTDKQTVMPKSTIDYYSSTKRNKVLIHGDSVGEFQRHCVK